EVLKGYISILNQRDSFLGNVFSLMDAVDYEDDMANAYYGCLSTTILDILWRASMLDHFFGIGMGERGIREAIIFYDMDRLDAPTIGAFV
ncbi:MAG: YkgJ family cysteine cluster protein, partial [Candidatus Methanoplasma sp.]|nr:YkgJ family cysteine cluster protein [Candidatus Methanoplasma sp.]